MRTRLGGLAIPVLPFMLAYVVSSVTSATTAAEVTQNTVRPFGSGENAPSSQEIAEQLVSRFAHWSTPHDLLTADSRAFAEWLDTARPTPLTAEAKARVLNSLPVEGEIKSIDGSGRQKLAALRLLLQATGRDSEYEIKVADVPTLRVGVYERTVILISKTALALLDPEELQAVGAHEIGHEYFTADYERASGQNDKRRLKELELMCDAVALVTLVRLHVNPSRLISAFEKVTRYNRQYRKSAVDESAYPTLSERRTFTHDVIAWLSVPRSQLRSEDASIPRNLDAGAFQATVELMWRLSPTFRQQGARLAAEPRLRVLIRIESSHSPSAARARTEISRVRGIVTRADVVLVRAGDAIELIAHEIEHIVEQIEGLSLRESACDAGRLVTAKESCRAIEMGKRVAGEVEGGQVDRKLTRSGESRPRPPHASASSNPTDRAIAFFEKMPRQTVEWLRLLRPSAVEATERIRALSQIPRENMVEPSADEVDKIASLQPVFVYHDRQTVVIPIVIDVPVAAVALHARAVVLMSRVAVRLLSGPELQAVVAHEIGHEYFWSQYNSARARHDLGELQSIELQCDGIAVLTLSELGIDPMHLLSAVDKIGRFNEVPGNRWGSNGYPSPDERRRFVRALLQARANSTGGASHH
jgi:hypothetical protein